MNSYNWGSNLNMAASYPPLPSQPFSLWSWSNHVPYGFNNWFDSQGSTLRNFTLWYNPNSNFNPNLARIPNPNLNRIPVTNGQISERNPVTGCPTKENASGSQASNGGRPSRKVKLKPLPFYNEVKRLLVDDVFVAPVLSYSREYRFKVDLGLGIFSRKDYEILVRMCPFLANKQHDDNIPPEITIEVNGTPCNITNHKAPLIITEFCRNVKNVIRIVSNKGNGKYHLLMIVVVKKILVKQLMKKVKPIGMQDAIDFVKKIFLEHNGEISSTVHQCSLTCPLGKIRMTVPGRSANCKHIQCFDALLYLQMNERYGRWMCPVCHTEALPCDLKHDMLFDHILATADASVTRINIESDGTWKPVVESAIDKKVSPENVKKGTKRIIVIDLVDDDEDSVDVNVHVKQETESPRDTSPKAKRAKVDTIISNTKAKEQVTTLRRSNRLRKIRRL